jgi:predicted nucleotide-binding protein
MAGEYTHEQLKHMTVAQLREIASEIEHDAVKGYTQLRKDEIIHGICVALDIDEVEHHKVVGLDKAAVKTKIQALKAERVAALEGGDSAALKMARKKIRRLKRKIRRSTV